MGSKLRNTVLISEQSPQFKQTQRSKCDGVNIDWKVSVLEADARKTVMLAKSIFGEYFFFGPKQLLLDFVLIRSDADVIGIDGHFRDNINVLPLNIYFFLVINVLNQTSPLK